MCLLLCSCSKIWSGGDKVSTQAENTAEAAGYDTAADAGFNGSISANMDAEAAAVASEDQNQTVNAAGKNDENAGIQGNDTQNTAGGSAGADASGRQSGANTDNADLVGQQESGNTFGLFFNTEEDPSDEHNNAASEDERVDVGVGPGDAESWHSSTIFAPGAASEKGDSDPYSGADDAGGGFGLEQASPTDSSGEGLIEIVEGPDGQMIPVSGEIPTAASFTVFGEDHSIQTIVPEPVKPYEYVEWQSCTVEGQEVVVEGTLTGSITPSNTLMGEDTNLYLLELQPYEDSIDNHRYVAVLPKNAADLRFCLELPRGRDSDRLYNKFVACVWNQDHYIAVSDPVYITNPETTARHQKPYMEPLSKKGLLIERSQVSDAFSLGVCNVIVNIPFHQLFGEGIDYTYDGETYHFNREVVETYDNTVSMFSNKSMNVSAVLLNGYSAEHPELISPGTSLSGSHKYYHFNTATEDGYKAIRALASFLAERYNGEDPDCGKVQNWIIGNEINNQEWNCLGPMSLDRYAAEYERSFRVFYTAIKSTCANDRVFFSLDHNWNREANGLTRYNARDTLAAVSRRLSRYGNIDWGLAYHPYSEPMTEPEFWDDFSTGQVTYYEDSPVINFANLSLLTDYMQKSEMRDREGHVRHIILSEEGFTSRSATRGEVQELQAAAFAYAYYIADSNLFIDAFILSRQIDAPSELKSSLAFGLWTTKSTSDGNILPDQRKYIWEVFKNIDRRQKTLEYTAFAKEILGIERWQDVIPGFRWTRYE